MHYPFQLLAESNSDYSAEMKTAAARVIDSGWYLHGKETQEFETKLSDICNVDVPAVGVSNGLDAIRLILHAYIRNGRLKRGDEVIVQADTYIASVLPIVEAGLKPVFADASLSDLNLDFEAAEKLVGPHTKAVILVHLYGNPCWNEEIVKRWADQGMLIIEDNAQAIGARASGKGIFGTDIAGGLGHAAAFSFYPSKNIGALGDAGAVVTRDEELRDTIKALSNYGSHKRYFNKYRGFNCRLDEMQAAFLNIKFSHLQAETDRRRAVAKAYDETISSPIVTKPRIFTDRLQVWHQYPLLAERRDDLQHYLADNGVGTMIHYPLPPHRQECFADLWDANTWLLPVADDIAARELSIPIANITPDDARKIAKIINEFE